ncbi:hypothetical protein [Pseudomonas serbica]|uniref:hypothetical protein n=1 Tax=Pseudomonas serbica TaxID=2965074 RepID=UPI00237C2F59|nr:hypothetical protein [Pseudomonas serbica]
MSNSFAKEFVQLMAVGTSTLLKQSASGISTILKESAKVIEKAADVADWPQFEVSSSPDSTVLTFDLKDLDSSEFEVSYNEQSVRLNIRPYCEDYLIPNVTRFFSRPRYSTAEQLKLAKFAKSHQHVRWSTCTADELTDFFTGWVFRAEGQGDGQFWQSRAMVMLKPLIAGAISMRDAGACVLSAAWFKDHMPLDAYLTLIDNEYVDQQALMAYLDALPAFYIQEAQENNLSPKCYENHGYMTMQVFDLLETDQKSGVVRTDRRPDRDIARNFISKTIVSAEAVRVENRLEITVKHASKEFVRLKVQG